MINWKIHKKYRIFKLEHYLDILKMIDYRLDIRKVIEVELYPYQEKLLIENLLKDAEK